MSSSWRIATEDAPRTRRHFSEDRIGRLSSLESKLLEMAQAHRCQKFLVLISTMGRRAAQQALCSRRGCFAFLPGGPRSLKKTKKTLFSLWFWTFLRAQSLDFGVAGVKFLMCCEAM